MIFEAVSIEAVRKVIEEDPYWAAGVVRTTLPCLTCSRLADALNLNVQWDPEGLIILPILLPNLPELK